MNMYLEIPGTTYWIRGYPPQHLCALDDSPEEAFRSFEFYLTMTRAIALAPSTRDYVDLSEALNRDPQMADRLTAARLAAPDPWLYLDNVQPAPAPARPQRKRQPRKRRTQAPETEG